MASNESDVCRLNNDEYRELIPHLEFEDLFMTQIKKGSNWYQLFNCMYTAQKQLNSLKCEICHEKLAFDSFGTHLKKVTHVNLLQSVDQFFHPFYTYTKNYDKLAKGESVSKEELQEAIAKADAEALKLTDFKMTMTKRVAQFLREKKSAAVDNDFEKLLLTLVTTTDVKMPENILVDVSLPLLDLLKLEFSTEEGKWNPMLTTNQPLPNSKYYCALCSKYCAGIITVNAHAKGYLHKSKQLASLGVRCPGYDHLTKNCGYRFDQEYSLTIKDEARSLYKEKISSMLKANQGNGSAGDHKGNADSKIVEFYSPKKLSAVVAAKVKALKQHRVQFDVKGLIGVEYVVKIMKTENDPTPTYECCLCEVALSESRMQVHLIGYNHRQKYCEVHYPDTIKKYKNIIGHVKYSDYFNAMGHILTKVALAIEHHHGRSLPYVVSESKFTTKRAEIVALVYSFRNACQQQGPSFSNAMKPEEIKKIIAEKKVFKQQIYGQIMLPARFTTVPDGKVYLDQRCHDPNKRSEISTERKRPRSKSPRPKNVKYENERTHTRSRSHSLDGHSKYSNEHRSKNTNDIWRVYRDEMSVAANKVERLYVEYRKNPESHPLYDEEWNKFWRRRKEELLTQGMDHRSYNYQPEWVVFFRQRLEQLFGEELQTLKVDIRRRLNIPLDAEEDGESQRHTVNAAAYEVPSRKMQISAPFLDNTEPQIKRQCNETWKVYSTGEWSEDRAQKLTPPGKSFDAKTQSHGSDQEKPIQMPVKDDKPNVIHVLRLLTALEDHLGSLGTKIMNLLSRALTLEKTCMNNPAKLEQQLLTFDNCTLLETAVEKLKGLLYAGLLDDSKVQGFNRVIQYTSEMLKYADRMGWRNVPVEFSEKSSTGNELQKLIEEMQNVRSGAVTSSQKSLSDTLMELISMQKRNIPETTEQITNKPLEFPCNEKQPLSSYPYNRPLEGSNTLENYKSNYQYLQNMALDTKNNNPANPMSVAPIFGSNMQTAAFANRYNLNNQGNSEESGRNTFNRNFTNIYGNNIPNSTGNNIPNSTGNNSMFGNIINPRPGPRPLSNQVGNLLANSHQKAFMHGGDGRGSVGGKGSMNSQMWPSTQKF